MTEVPASRYGVFALLAGGGILFDLYSKSTVFHALGYPNGSSPLLMDLGNHRVMFRLYTSMNAGALWGMGQGKSWLFAGLSVLAIGSVLYWLFIKGGAASRWLTVSLALIMAGTVGNLYDRIGLHQCINPETGQTWHAVRDFLLFTFRMPSGQFWSWPVFNFADVFLVTGAIMLVVQSLCTSPATEMKATSLPVASKT